MVSLGVSEAILLSISVEEELLKKTKQKCLSKQKKSTSVVSKLMFLYLFDVWLVRWHCVSLNVFSETLASHKPVEV